MEEPERYSVWGKIRLDQLTSDVPGDAKTIALTQACLLLLQGVYIDIEDLLGGRQAGLFGKNLAEILQQWRFPQADSPQAVKNLLTIDPLSANQLPPWEEHHIITLLQELYRLGKQYFGNASFVSRAMDTLEDLPAADQAQFTEWLNQSPLGKLWQ